MSPQNPFTSLKIFFALGGPHDVLDADSPNQGSGLVVVVGGVVVQNHMDRAQPQYLGALPCPSCAGTATRRRHHRPGCVHNAPRSPGQGNANRLGLRG